MPIDESKPYYILQGVGEIPTENPEGRFERDYESMGTKVVPQGIHDSYATNFRPYAGATAKDSDDRKYRQLDAQSDERQSRLYVDRVTGVSATGKDHEVKDILFAASAAKDINDPNYPTAEEVETAYEADISNENRPASMFNTSEDPDFPHAR